MDDNKKNCPENVPVMHSNVHECRTLTVVLRIVLLAFAITSLALIATDSQTSSVPLPFFGLPKPVYLTRTADYKLIKGLKFFVDTLGIVIAYTTLHLMFNIGLLATRRTVVGSKSVAWTSFVVDSAMAYLLLSGAAVATEIGYLAERGAPDLMWNKVCNYFDHFCTVYAISVVASFLAALAAFFLVGISAYHLFRLYGLQQHQALCLTGKQESSADP